MNKLIPICVAPVLLSGCFDSDNDKSYDDVNSAPVAQDLSVTTQTETPVTDTLTATDADGDPLTFMVSSEPMLGSVTIADNGQFTYTPNSELTGMDNFSYTVSDGTAFGVTGSVSITIEALDVSFTSAVREAFNQNATDMPLRVNGRVYLQDATSAAEFDDLLTD